MQEMLHSTIIIPVATEKNSGEPLLVMGSTTVKRPFRFLRAIREISDQILPCLPIVISFSARQMAAVVAVRDPARKRSMVQ